MSLRSLICGSMRARGVLAKFQPPIRIQVRHSDDHGPTRPFDNMPFKVTNRYFATVVFAVMFGTGLWAPLIIVWYSMAKKTL